ncbi:MAG: protein kinase domain-containing protein [Actinomycetota bacterium]
MQTERPATVLANRYALREELGRSGTGMVWRADDILLDRVVTVKLIHPSLADDPAFAKHLAEEARRVASLAAPGIARLLDSGRQDGVPYLVREHVEGESARDRLDAGGPFAPREASRIATEVLEALGPAHGAGVLHLHLELDDVLLTPDGGVRVTDLGIGPAVSATGDPADAARLLGGDGLAPEQSAGGAVDRRTDVFAVGAVLFELLTGEPPRGRRSPRDVRPRVPRSLDRVVCRALADDPHERFDDVASFATALRDGDPEEAPGVEGGHRHVIRGWLGVPAAVALVAAAAIVAGLWLGRLEVGGPLGIRAAEEPRTETVVEPSTRTVRPVTAVATDPFGDEDENDEDAALALDGDEGTAWRTENYFDDTLNNKPGVGLVFDLGASQDVTGFRLSTPHPGFAFHVAVGDDPAALVALIGVPFTAGPETRGTIEATGRYVLVWITSVVPVEDGNRAEVAEFRVTVVADA